MSHRTTALWRLLAAAALLTCALAVACGESREGYRDEMAETLCDRADACGDIGEGQAFSSYDDCLVERTKNVNDAWPDSRCGGGAINGDKFDDCVDRAERLPCQGGLLDIGAFFLECNASSICIDPVD